MEYLMNTSESSDNADEVSITELAALEGLTIPAVAQRVQKFERDGLIETKRVRGRKLVNVAEYRRVRAETMDYRRTQAAATKRAQADGVPTSHSEAQTLKLHLDVEMKALELERRRGGLVAIDGPQGINAALATAAGSILSALELLPTRAPEIVSAARKDDGPLAVRALLKTFIHDVREIIAKEMEDVTRGGKEAEAADDIFTDVEILKDSENEGQAS
jgi:DNA-binding transcriptional ArsR family regulator